MYSYWHLHEIEHEALQRMYGACRKGRDFPGTLPDETSGGVTTHAILQGLRLIGADDDESVFQDILKESPSSAVWAGGPRQNGATRATPPSSSPSLSDHSTATSRSRSFDTRAALAYRVGSGRSRSTTHGLLILTVLRNKAACQHWTAANNHGPLTSPCKNPRSSKRRLSRSRKP